MNKSLINKLIGNKIEEIRVMSFFLNYKLVCDTVVFFIKIENENWYKLTTSDGNNIIEYIEPEPKILSIDKIEDEFAYPVKKISSDYVGKLITNIKQYSFLGKEDELNGFYIELENGIGFSLYGNEDCLSISDGIILEKNYVLL